MAKQFKLAAGQIRELVPPHGSCIASDRITVDGATVGYMYRETPDHPHDSGWRFFAGDESEEYAHDARNFELFDVNTICNYDRSIIPYLERPVGSAFGRAEAGGAFAPEPWSPPAE